MKKVYVQKIAGIGIALAMLVAFLLVLPSTISRAENPVGIEITHSDDDGYIAPGETLTITVSLTGYEEASKPITALQVSVPLDVSMVEYISSSVVATANLGDIIAVGYNNITQRVEFVYTSNSYDEMDELIPLPTSNTALFELTIRTLDNLETDLILTLIAGMYGDATGTDYEILNILASPPYITLNGLVPAESPYDGNVTIRWNKGQGTLAMDDGEAIPITSGHAVSSKGDYSVTVVDNVGNTSSVSFSISPTLHSPELIVDPPEGVEGQPLSLSASASDGLPPYEYQFYVIDAENERQTIQSYSTTNTCSWIPATAGTYTLGVEIKDDRGDEVSSEKEVTISPYVPPLSIAVFRAGWSDNYELGQTINLAARGEGGTEPYKYQFYVLRSNGNRVNFRKDPVFSNIYPWTPVTPDTYTLGVDVYDATGSKVTEEKTITVIDSNPLRIAVFRAGWSDTYELGQTIDLAARGEGGTAPYKYQFYVIRSNGSRVNFRKTPVSSNIYPWTPVTPDTYILGVDVYDATGKKVTEEKTITVTNDNPLYIAVFRAGWSDTYEIGQTIDLAARGEGGTAPYKYQFYVLRSNGSRVNFRKTPVSSNIYPWTPVTPDTYTLGVDVYDAAGRKVTEEKTITVLPAQ